MLNNVAVHVVGFYTNENANLVVPRLAFPYRGNNNVARKPGIYCCRSGVDVVRIEILIEEEGCMHDGKNRSCVCDLEILASRTPRLKKSLSAFVSTFC